MMKTYLATALIAAGLTLTPLTTQAARAGALSEPARAALLRALEDERHAEAFYTAVIAKFGNVRPFANIIKAERRHADEVIAVMAQYDIEAPPNGFAASPPEVPATLQAACKAGVEAEVANKSLYDEQLIPAAQGYSDITALFERLRDASQNNHLPAFTRCAG